MGWQTTVAEVESEPAVIFDGVDKSFGTLRVFRQLSLRLPKDRTTAIVGASGSGRPRYCK